MGRLSERRIFGVAFVVIVTLAVYLRLAHLELAEFKRDEAQIALIAADVVAGRRLPLVGIGTSVPGLENGPVMIYLTALPLLLSHDAALASGFIALLNVVALIVSARVTERIFGRLAALFAAATYAVGSWAVLFSRKLWPNEAMPVFSALLALALYEAAVAGRVRGVVLAGLWLGVLVNLHPSGIVFVPVVGAALLMRPALLKSRGALLGGALLLFVSAPFLVHEAMNRFPALGALKGTAGSQARVDGSAFQLAAMLVGPDAYRVLAGGLAEGFRARALPAAELDVVMAALLLSGVAVALVQLIRAWRRGAGWRAFALALCWISLPLLLSSRRTVTLQIHYLILLIPLLFPFVGVALAAPTRLVRGAPPLVRAASLALPALLLLWAAVVQVQHFDLFFGLVRDGGALSPYGTPLLVQRTAAERAVVYASGRPIVLVSQPKAGESADDQPPIWRFLVPEPLELQVDDGGGALRLTPGGALYVVAPAADPVVGDLLGARGVPAGRGVPIPGLARGFEYWRAGVRAPSSAVLPVGRVGAGLRLDEVGMSPATRAGGVASVPTLGGAPLQVLADWRVERTPAAPDELAFFTHLLDDRGERLAGRDRPGVEAWRLEEGDELLTWATLSPPPSLPPGRYWVAVGAYRARDRIRLTASDADGRPTGDQLRIGPFKVPITPPPDPPPPTPLARFGPIELESARVDASNAPPTVDLVWRAQTRPDRDLTVFVHFYGGDGRLAAQDDRQPADRGYPTSIWDAGERVADRHRVAAAPGRYSVRVGLYDASSLQRVSRLDAPGDAVELGQVEVP